MNTTTQIESLFKQGVVQVNFGKSPDGADWLAEVRQVVDTGDKGQIHLVHQIAASSVVDCLNKAALHVSHANVLPVSFPRRN